MFRSIRWKLVAVLVFVVISLVIIVGSFFQVSVSNFYTDEFTDSMETAFSGELGNRLIGATTPAEYGEIIQAYSGRLGLGAYRYCCVLDGKSGALVFSSDLDLEKHIEKNQNIISAMAGKTGKVQSFKNQYMDYAYPVIRDGSTAFVVYIFDSKVEISEIMSRILITILEALLLGFVIALIFGFFLSGTITAPIANLTKKAESFAAGNFETKINVHSHDEIGKLSDTFNYMAGELKTNIKALSEEKEKLESILRYMTDGIMAFDKEGNVLHINKAAAKMLGINENDSISFDEFFRPYVNITVQEVYFKSNSVINRDFEHRGKNLQAFFVLTGLGKSLKHQSNIIVVLHDITELQKMEMNRREFVANVSHELKTPLTTVKSYAETILESENIPKEMENNFLGVIVSEADRMNRLVHDLLLLSKLDYKGNQPEKDPVDIKPVISDILRRMHLAIEEKSQKVSFSIPDNLPRVCGNRDKLDQVFLNIISNAVKYTDEGGSISVLAGEMYGSVFVKISDTGMGIPEEDLPHIFDRFYRVDKARSRQAGGTGLGLAIAKEIIEAHGGKISATSTYGQGTEFTINLPVFSENQEK
ncbi:MAG: HAMP domain-containing protein [Clostridia bacterium]|nr:HAMP domain-containing protein [Clostridia bacterium]